MREKKTWRKTLNQDDVMDSIHANNKEKRQLSEAKAIADDSLFKVNVDKKGLKLQREKLKRDRFK